MRHLLLRRLISSCSKRTSTPSPSCYYYNHHSHSHSTHAHKYDVDSNAEAEEKELPSHILQLMERRISAMEQRHGDLLRLIEHQYEKQEQDHMFNQVESKGVNKELRQLAPSIQLMHGLRSKKEEINGLRFMVSDPEEDREVRQMANEELNGALREQRRLQNQMFRLLLPKDEADHRDCIIEVRAGTGGEEASLFAMDIFKMYERYCHKVGWKFDVIQLMESELKGYKEASGAISGSGAYGKLKFESGIHRVQRVPVTEKSGRVHTSAVSVAILPQADEVDVQVRNEDLRIDTYRAGGCGGQSVNTTNSAVRVAHIPSGIVVAIQDERSQHMNKAKALKVLRSRLYEIERARLQMDRSKLRSDQIGSGDRSERIRTYNFPQGRVTDHRIGVTHHSIEDVLAGESLDIFIDALLLREEMEAIASFTSEKTNI